MEGKKQAMIVIWKIFSFAIRHDGYIKDKKYLQFLRMIFFC